MSPIYIFLATFVTVFSLGFQSLNVNNDHYRMAAFTSLMIGSSHLVLYKMLPEGGWLQCGAYLIAGPLGIVCSMKAHGRYRTWIAGRKANA